MWIDNKLDLLEEDIKDYYMKGYHVFDFKRDVEALRKLNEIEFKILMTNPKNVDMKIEELLRQARDFCPDIKIVIYSDNDNVGLMVSNFGCDAGISKVNFTRNRILSTVQDVLK